VAGKQTTIRVTADELKKGLRLYPGRYRIIVERPTVSVDVLEAEDTLFRSASSVFLPTRIPEEVEDDSPFETPPEKLLEAQRQVSGLAVMAGLFRYYDLCLRRKAAKHILITGHTDSVGSVKSNEELSHRRAQVVLSVIEGTPQAREAFAGIVHRTHVPEDEQHILQWIAAMLDWSDVNPGPIDGKIGNKTQAAIRRFKQRVQGNDFPPPKYQGLAFSSDIDELRSSLGRGSALGQRDWAMFFELYQAELQHMLQDDDLHLPSLRSRLRWVFEDKKAVGCGETWPIDARGQDNFKSQANRRVEIVFYDPQEFKGELPCKDGTCAREECHVYRDIGRQQGQGGPFDARLDWRYICLDEDGGLTGRDKVEVKVVDVPDMLFHHEGRLPCLDSEDYLVGALATALLYARDEAGISYADERGTKLEEELVLFGHSDTSGGHAVNYNISEQRAQAVKSLLNRDQDVWTSLAQSHGRVEEYQGILATLTKRHGWACDPGQVDNVAGPKSKAAVRAFQEQANARYGLGLTQDGIVGAKTWTAFHRVLCGLVARAMGLEDPPSARYPQWPLPPFGYPAGEGCYGCGESFPVEKTSRDGVKSQANRRVELAFLPKTVFDLEPPPDTNRGLDLSTWPITSRSGIEWKTRLVSPLPWDKLTMGETFWKFFQDNMPHKHNSAQFHAMLEQVYGDDITPEIADELRREFVNGKVPAPSYAVVQTLDFQRLAAYRENTIYLNRQLVVDAGSHPQSRWLLLMALVHEAGHHLDDHLRKNRPWLDPDSPGDEGAALARAYMTQTENSLLDRDLVFADITYESPAAKSTRPCKLTVRELDDQKRARAFWNTELNIGPEEGELQLEDGQKLHVEFWAITGVTAGVHEEITKKAAIAAGYEVPEDLLISSENGGQGFTLSPAVQEHPDKYAWDKHLYQGCAWPDVPYQADENTVDTDYKNFILVYFDASAGVRQPAGWVRDVGVVKGSNNWAWRSHFGDWQHWHSMCPVYKDSRKITNGAVKAAILGQFSIWWDKAVSQRSAGAPGRGLFFIGKMLHTLQDSYCHSHAWRRYVGDDSDDDFKWEQLHHEIASNGLEGNKITPEHHGSIWTFQSYGDQESGLHALADKADAVGYSQALKATQKILEHYKAGANWDTVNDYLDRQVYRIHPERVDKDAGGSHPWFKKYLTADQERHKEKRMNDRTKRNKKGEMPGWLKALKEKANKYELNISDTVTVDPIDNAEGNAEAYPTQYYGEYICY
jgi:outer membrane protein OmpA-like peptidoglycan-associated protein